MTIAQDSDEMLQQIFSTLDLRFEEVRTLVTSRTDELGGVLAKIIESSFGGVEIKAPIMDLCDHGHKFAKLEDHPKRNGRPMCPYCMANGLKRAWTELGEATDNQVMLRAASEIPLTPDGV